MHVDGYFRVIRSVARVELVVSGSQTLDLVLCARKAGTEHSFKLGIAHREALL
jgi:hypothetical protein